MEEDIFNHSAIYQIHLQIQATKFILNLNNCNGNREINFQNTIFCQKNAIEVKFSMSKFVLFFCFHHYFMCISTSFLSSKCNLQLTFLSLLFTNIPQFYNNLPKECLFEKTSCIGIFFFIDLFQCSSLFIFCDYGQKSSLVYVNTVNIRFNMAVNIELTKISDVFLHFISKDYRTVPSQFSLKFGDQTHMSFWTAMEMDCIS